MEWTSAYFRMPTEMHANIRKLMEKEDRSFAKMTLVLLKEALANRGINEVESV